MGNPQVTPVAEYWHDGGFIVSEGEGHLSRDSVTLSGGTKVYAGTVLGQQTLGTSAGAVPLATNAGNGTVGAISLVALPTQIGPYSVVFTSATAFTVFAPNGSTATGVIGTAFNALGIGFTITAGGTAMAAGDRFTITTVANPGMPGISSAAGGSNVGNAALGALSVAGYAPSQGVYSIQFASPTQFAVLSPSGEEIGHGAVGTAFKGGGIGFTITAGGTAFAFGDEFAISLAAGSGNWIPCVATAVDGSQTPAGILYGTKDVTTANKPATVIVRAAEVNGSELVWDPSWSATEIASAGLAALEAIKVSVR